MMKYTIYKILLFVTLFVFSFNLEAQIQTKNHLPYKSGEKNWINSKSYGQTGYQVDRSKDSYLVYNENDKNYYQAYYYYVYFFSYSQINDGGWKRVGTYIPSIKVSINNQLMGETWMLITGEYYYLVFWHTDPNAEFKISYSKPIPY